MAVGGLLVPFAADSPVDQNADEAEQRRGAENNQGKTAAACAQGVAADGGGNDRGQARHAGQEQKMGLLHGG